MRKTWRGHSGSARSRPEAYKKEDEEKTAIAIWGRLLGTTKNQPPQFCRVDLAWKRKSSRVLHSDGKHEKRERAIGKGREKEDAPSMKRTKQSEIERSLPNGTAIRFKREKKAIT